jgi:uncharacterized protein
LIQIATISAVAYHNPIVFDTSILDAALTEQASRFEQERRLVVERLRQWLDDHGRQYGLTEAYIFGSLAKANRFTPRSDIDLAVTFNTADPLLSLMSALSRAFGREVDVVELNQCHFADKIRREGLVWTPSD